MELRKPLRSFVPSDTSAVIGRYWTTEFMAFEPNHPLLVEAAAKITANVHRQLQYIREGNTRRASHTSQTSFPARHKPKSPRFLIDATPHASPMVGHLMCSSIF